MATVLRALRLKRVSLVDNPANQGARVVLLKSADSPLDDCAVCKAELAGETRGDLSDKDFAAVWTDSEGRKQRKLPIHDAAHVRNALSRFNQTDMPADVKAKAKAKLDAAKAKFNIGDDASKGQPAGGGDVSVDTFAQTRCKKCDAYMKAGTKTCPKCGQPMPAGDSGADEPDADDMAKSADRPREDKMADDKMKADLDTATKQVELLTKQVADLSKKVEGYENTPEAIEKRKMEALPESVRKQMEEDRAEIKKLRDDKADAIVVSLVKSAMPNISGKYEETGKLLKRVKDAVSEEDFKALSTILTAASEQIAKGKLFAVVGSDGDANAADETALGKIRRLAKERVAKSDKLSMADAEAQVIAEDPALYKAYTEAAQSLTLRKDDAN